MSKTNIKFFAYMYIKIKIKEKNIRMANTKIQM